MGTTAMFRPRHYAAAAAIMTVLAMVQHWIVQDSKGWHRELESTNRRNTRAARRHKLLMKYAHKLDPFWDFVLFDKRQNTELYETAVALDSVQSYVDWEALHDNFIIATFASDQRRNLKRKPRARRRRGPKSMSSQVQNEFIDRLSGTTGTDTHTGGQAESPTEADVIPEERNTDDSLGVDDDATGRSGNTVFLPIYNYTTGKCLGPGDSNLAVPCAPDDLEEICDKYNDKGSFRACLAACRPSFCCIHDAPPPDPNSQYTPTLQTEFNVKGNCNTDVNCAQYAYCYIVWWKLHDTIGPATALRLNQSDVPFYDTEVDDPEIKDFELELLLHHFNDSAAIIGLGLEPTPDGSQFNSSVIFLNETYWNTTI